jgi:hypothetical protein
MILQVSGCLKPWSNKGLASAPLTGELIRQLRLHTRLELEASCFGPLE